MLRPRIVEPEWLDALPSSDPRAVASRSDLARLNAVMGQARIMSGLLKTLPRTAPPRTLLDLGSGDGLFLLGVARLVSRIWPGVAVTLLDRQTRASPRTLAAFERFGWTAQAVSDDLFAYLRDERSSPVDLITANLVLHHFSSELLGDLFKLAALRTRSFAACEPRRAPLALGGSRLVGLLGCNAVTRHDAVASVRAGFRDRELSNLWPDYPGWLVTERDAGLFAHCLLARHVP